MDAPSRAGQFASWQARCVSHSDILVTQWLNYYVRMLRGRRPVYIYLPQPSVATLYASPMQPNLAGTYSVLDSVGSGRSVPAKFGCMARSWEVQGDVRSKHSTLVYINIHV